MKKSINLSVSLDLSGSGLGGLPATDRRSTRVVTETETITEEVEVTRVVEGETVTEMVEVTRDR